MAHNIKALTCQVAGNTVYVRDERGNIVDIFTFNSPPVAQSFGNGVTITSGTLCFTYTLGDDGKLVQSGMYGV